MVIYGTINGIPVKGNRKSFLKDSNLLIPIQNYCNTTGNTFEEILKKIGYCSTYLKTVKFVSSEFIDKLQALGVQIDITTLTPKMSLLDQIGTTSTSNLRTFRKLGIKKEQDYLTFSPTGKYVYLEDIDKNLVKYLGNIYTFTECFDLLMGTMIYEHGYPCEYFFKFNGTGLDFLIARKGLDFYPSEYAMDAEYKVYIESIKKRYVSKKAPIIASPQPPKGPENPIDYSGNNPFLNINYMISKAITEYCQNHHLDLEKFLEGIDLKMVFLRSSVISEKNLDRIIEAGVPIKKEQLLRLNDKISIKRDEKSDLVTVFFNDLPQNTNFDQILQEFFLENTEGCHSFAEYKQKKFNDYLINNQGSTSFKDFLHKS